MGWWKTLSDQPKTVSQGSRPPPWCRQTEPTRVHQKDAGGGREERASVQQGQGAHGRLPSGNKGQQKREKQRKKKKKQPAESALLRRWGTSANPSDNVKSVEHKHMVVVLC